ncbi:MAG TPA: pyridoxal phosphate-dependent aminotransferase [Caulobacteraceae bacterium]
MRYAKLETGAKYNLASSGVADCEWSDLGLEPTDLALNDPSPYGWRPLVETIASRFNVDPACVVIPGGGCSFANHLAMAAILSPGDEVLIEDPTYELLTSTASFLGARTNAFPRSLDRGWRLDPEAVRAQVTPATRAAIVTNLHNPSGAPAADSDVEALADLVPILLVDEVYRELSFDAVSARTAFREDGKIVVTSSLTKAYGLSGLRCGWILAPAPLAERMRRLNDLFGVKSPHVAERMALTAFERLDALRARAVAHAGPNRAAYTDLMGEHPALDQILFDHATTVFPRLRRGDGDAFVRWLKERFETSVAPGSFFGAPDYIRVGLGGEPAATREALARLAEALEVWEGSARSD